MSLIALRRDNRFIPQRADGTIKDSTDPGRSLTADRRQQGKSKAPNGQDDRGDR